MKFEKWWELFSILADKYGLAYNEEYKDAYREYWEDGDTPTEAVQMELSYLDG